MKPPRISAAVLSPGPAAATKTLSSVVKPLPDSDGARAVRIVDLNSAHIGRGASRHGRRCTIESDRGHVRSRALDVDKILERHLLGVIAWRNLDQIGLGLGGN